MKEGKKAGKMSQREGKGPIIFCQLSLERILYRKRSGGRKRKEKGLSESKVARRQLRLWV